ncbi:hypothetical protein [Arthrobacter sp. ES3-54]|uniref:hypothetical protein n=1 Tax=Arthrobacter sp. ES3-54 TaxID=1502991 RepID=UPI0024049389|nr:hypothetical protein [Arthrobacter sp. ES3-54]MDF9749099.1 sirohydrochlorin ferrochelatase [Arthrobacter sp. ES3-54]
MTFCLAIFTILSLVTAPVASAASDMTGPVMVSSAVTPKSLNIATGPASVKVTVRLTDQTGADEPVVTLGHDASGQSQGFGEMTLVSGTTRDGTWERTMTIPQGSATGTWRVTLFPLDDTLGNTSTGFQTLATLNVTGTPSDVTGPVMVSSTVTPKSLNIATGPATVKVTVRLTDRTGADEPVVTLGHDATGQSQGFGEMTLVSGTTRDGTWERTMTIPQGSATGTWNVTLFPLDDTLGNTSTGFQTLGTLNVTGTPSDVTGPVMVSSAVTPKSLNIATGPATVKVTVRLTDRTGADEPVVTLGHDTTGQSQGFGEMTLVSGTTRDGTWERTMTIPQGSATGTWNVTLFPLDDTLGNTSTGFQTLATLNVTATLPGLKATPTPTVSGTAKVGSTLTAVPGTWLPAPVALAYQWYRSGVAITGASLPSYKLTATDIGKTITVRVKGKKAGFTTTSKTSAPTIAVTAGTLKATTPTLSGTAKVGSTLTATSGTWSPVPVALTYQWYRSGVAITGTNLPSYKLTASDIGKSITVRVTGKQAGFTTTSKTSAPTIAVTAGTLKTATPTLSGTTKVGSTITAVPGTWSPAPVALTYQWYRSGVAITGANLPSYKLTATDIAKTVTVRVTGKKAGFTTTSKTSAPTAAVSR